MPALIKQDLFHNQKMATTKVTKVRRTRQPKNPQLSVARRNERERNRVKMVNNGFALLREHLPVEDLEACEQHSEDGDTPTPDGAPKSAKSKKFSKVETLRAAIQRIRMLEDLIRSTEPGFESINIRPNSQMAYDEEPLSVCEPLSCSSSQSNSTGTMNHHDMQTVLRQQIAYGQAPEQFVKLEPHQQQQQQPQQQQMSIANLLSPQDSQTSHNNGLNNSQQYLPTQVHQSQPEQPSHTHLWIQQHQSSFMEQQLQYQQHQQQQQQQYQHQQQQHWYTQQQHHQTSEHKGNWNTVQHNESTNDTHIGTQQQQQQQMQHQHHQSQPQHLNHQQQVHLQSPGSQQSLQTQIDSPVWFSSGSPASVQSASQPMAFGHHHQHHQISLYSQ